jgi:D-alanyl-D-alanine carboxypeptidase (penicillin-binding protein 5/6)
MDRHDGWFSPENVEEEIAGSLDDREQASTNTRLLQDLQITAQDDARRLAEIRARLLQEADDQAERAPRSLRDGQLRITQPPRRPGPRSSKPSWRSLANLASGLVAVLLIGSLLFALAHFGIHPGQGPLSRQTPIPTSSVQDTHGISAFLMDATSGKVLVDVNSHVRRPIANLASIMTAVVAIDYANPDQEITVEQATLSAAPKGMGTAGLQTGDRISLHDLLYGLLLPSGDDAALVIAQAVGGSTQQFVAMMNDEAHQLQLNDTHFADPYNSSSSDSYSSAADLGRLANYAMQLSLFSQIVMTPDYTLAATAQHHSYHWRATNTSLAAGSNVQVMQVGYDAGSGACVVFSVLKNDHMLIGVELHAPSEKVLDSDVTELLRRGSGS